MRIGHLVENQNELGVAHRIELLGGERFGFQQHALVNGVWTDLRIDDARLNDLDWDGAVVAQLQTLKRIAGGKQPVLDATGIVEGGANRVQAIKPHMRVLFCRLRGLRLRAMLAPQPGVMRIFGRMGRGLGTHDGAIYEAVAWLQTELPHRNPQAGTKSVCIAVDTEERSLHKALAIWGCKPRRADCLVARFRHRMEECPSG
ncbi:hypothetical protein GCM10016234_07330 [Tianweitania populi]|uniref:Uncharacterized protein n=1 Tax=Tianweitania populi TaxID=1607949 RepID=A0A8J3GJK0_9HYPH|nr:hypothetical protein GCM10016234_07330 [Tianweitania populi]